MKDTNLICEKHGKEKEVYCDTCGDLNDIKCPSCMYEHFNEVHGINAVHISDIVEKKMQTFLDCINERTDKVDSVISYITEMIMQVNSTKEEYANILENCKKTIQIMEQKVARQYRESLEGLLVINEKLRKLKDQIGMNQALGSQVSNLKADLQNKKFAIVNDELEQLINNIKEAELTEIDNYQDIAEKKVKLLEDLRKEFDLGVFQRKYIDIMENEIIKQKILFGFKNLVAATLNISYDFKQAKAIKGAVPKVSDLWENDSTKIKNTHCKSWHIYRSRIKYSGAFKAKFRVSYIDNSDSNTWKMIIGVIAEDPSNRCVHLSYYASGYGYAVNGGKALGGLARDSSYGAPYDTGSIITMERNAKNQLIFYNNDKYQGVASENITGDQYLATSFLNPNHELELLEVEKL